MLNTSDMTTRRQRSPIRRRIDQLRVQLWYGWLRHHSNGASSYALEKQLIPEGFARATEGGVSHRNRMARYAQGKHVPRAELVERVEQRYPGSRVLLEHPFWAIIDPDSDVQAHSTTWLSALGPDVRQIMFSSRPAATELALCRSKVTNRTLRKLEDRGTFEALAALGLLVREAREAGDEERAFECARCFWRVLLLIVSANPFRDHRSALRKLAGEALLDRVVYKGERVAIADAPIDVHESYLRFYCSARENEGRLEPGWRNWVRERLLLMRGDKGFDLLYALSIPMEATDELKSDASRYDCFLRWRFVGFKAWDYVFDHRRSPRSFMEDVHAFLTDPEGRWPELRSGGGIPDDSPMPLALLQVRKDLERFYPEFTDGFKRPADFPR